MTRQRKQLIAAAVAIMMVGLMLAGVPVSTLLLIGFAVAMVFMHAGHGGGSELSGHQHPRRADAFARRHHRPLTADLDGGDDESTRAPTLTTRSHQPDSYGERPGSIRGIGTG